MKLDAAAQYGSWTGQKVESFLGEARMPLRLSFESAAGLLVVPVWFVFQAGVFWSCSPEGSVLVKSLRHKPAVAFDLSTNDVPYLGVRGRGIAQCTTTEDDAALEQLLDRFVGVDSLLAQALLARDEPEALVQITPEWVTSWDFSSRMGDIEKIETRLPDAII
jgi:hypothetical protein